MIDSESKYILQMLFAVLNDLDPLPPPEDVDWGRLYRIAARHIISNMVWYGIDKLNIEQQPPVEIIRAFQTDCKKAIAREAVQHITLERLQQAFAEQGIAYLPLKGILIKYLYPQPGMRTMADLDIFFKDEQTGLVKKLLLDMGYSLESEGSYHDVYFKKPMINLQVHRWLVPQKSPYSQYFADAWDKAILNPENRYLYHFSPEDFYIHLISHLANHYQGAGTGVRSIIDIWLYHRHHGDNMNWQYVDSELEKINLKSFARNIFGLGEVWFAGAENSPIHDEMGEYIFASGVYGSSKNAQLSSMTGLSKQSEDKRLIQYKYYMQLFFPGLKHMTILYPALDKCLFYCR